MGNIYLSIYSPKEFIKKFHPKLAGADLMAVVSSKHGCVLGNDLSPSSIRRRKKLLGLQNINRNKTCGPV